MERIYLRLASMKAPFARFLPIGGTFAGCTAKSWRPPQLQITPSDELIVETDTSFQISVEGGLSLTKTPGSDAGSCYYRLSWSDQSGQSSGRINIVNPAYPEEPIVIEVSTSAQRRYEWGKDTTDPSTSSRRPMDLDLLYEMEQAG